MPKWTELLDRMNSFCDEYGYYRPVISQMKNGLFQCEVPKCGPKRLTLDLVGGTGDTLTVAVRNCYNELKSYSPRSFKRL